MKTKMNEKAVTKIQAAIIIAVIAVASVAAGGLYYITAGTGIKEIVIGAPVPISGSLASSGIDLQYGYQLAEEDINAAGGIANLGGSKLKFVFADTQSDTTVALSETQRIIDTYHPAVITGYYSTVTTVAAAPATERNRIPVLAPVSQGLKLTDSNYSYMFRNAIRADKTGIVGVDALMDMAKYFNTPLTKVAIIGTNDPSLIDILNSTRKRANEVGLQIVFDDTYPPGVTDISSMVSKLKAAKPDAVLCMSFITEALLLARTLKEFQVDAFAYFGVAGGGILEPDFIKTLGSTAEYFFGGTGWQRDLNIPGLADVVSRYEAKFGQFMNEHAGQAYVCAWIIKDVIEFSATRHPNNPLDGDSLKDAFLNIDITNGPATYNAAGHVKFTSNGDNMYATLDFMQILNGTQRTVWPLSVSSANPVWPLPSWASRT